MEAETDSSDSTAEALPAQLPCWCSRVACAGPRLSCPLFRTRQNAKIIYASGPTWEWRSRRLREKTHSKRL